MFLPRPVIRKSGIYYQTMESHSQQNSLESANNKSQSSAAKQTKTAAQVATNNTRSSQDTSRAQAVARAAAAQKLRQESNQHKESLSTKGNPGKQSAIKKTPPATQASTSRESKAGRHRKELVPNDHSLFIPLMIISLALVLMMGGQVFQELKERQVLQGQLERQKSSLSEAKKVRGQLDSIAKQTFQLSLSGNKNASQIVDKMKKAGFTFNQTSQ